MPANDSEDMRIDKFLPIATRVPRHIPKVPRIAFTRSSFLGLALLLACSFGCAPASSPIGDNQNPPASESAALPEITDEVISERINDAYVRKVPEENAAAECINWNFDENEPKEITVVEKQIEGERATIILDIKTGSAKGAREQRYLAGQIRTDWVLKTGWMLRKWEIVKTENISMKYRNLPKLSAQNSNR